jgi:adenylate cyclase
MSAMAQQLELKVIGPFSIRWSDGASASLTSRKAQGLLAYLAFEERATRDCLANLFWGELSEERARHNLRQALSKIRSTCGPVIEVKEDLLRLNADRCSVDVTEFVRLAQKDDEDSLQNCLDIYSGDLLESASPREAAFEDWLRLARDRLRHMACDAMDRYVRLLMNDEKFDRAILALGRRLSADPACEPAHRDLMIALTRIGRRSDALRQYEICAAALQRELGVAPSPETEALFAKIRHPDRGIGGGEQATSSKEISPESDSPRVAVLPFDNLSGPADSYFVDGITEDIITALSRFHSLQVIARGSTFVYKNSNATDSEVAEALHAQYLVRGSVRRADDRVRINVQLLDGPAGLTLWANRFELEMTDVFRVQDEITATVVSTLAGRVEATQLERARKATAQRLEAYDYLLRGKDYHHRFTADDCATCIDMFTRAIHRDPDYAVAHAWLACGLGQAMVWNLDDHARLVDRSQIAAERGLELDENESECHRILAQVHLTRGNLQRALMHQERALFLNPNDDRSVCSMGEILCFAGRHEEAEQWVRKSMRLNPYHPQRYWTHLARALFHLGRSRDALDVLEQIGRPRQDDFLYAIAASSDLGDDDAVRRNTDANLVAFPDCDAAGFIAMLPYERTADREQFRSALARAGLLST